MISKIGKLNKNMWNENKMLIQLVYLREDILNKIL